MIYDTVINLTEHHHKAHSGQPRDQAQHGFRTDRLCLTNLISFDDLLGEGNTWFRGQHLANDTLKASFTNATLTLPFAYH